MRSFDRWTDRHTSLSRHGGWVVFQITQTKGPYRLSQCQWILLGHWGRCSKMADRRGLKGGKVDDSGFKADRTPALIDGREDSRNEQFPYGLSAHLWRIGNTLGKPHPPGPPRRRFRLGRRSTMWRRKMLGQGIGRIPVAAAQDGSVICRRKPMKPRPCDRTPRPRNRARERERERMRSRANITWRIYLMSPLIPLTILLEQEEYTICFGTCPALVGQPRHVHRHRDKEISPSRLISRSERACCSVASSATLDWRVGGAERRPRKDRRTATRL